jgi:hypothetical protein
VPTPWFAMATEFREWEGMQVARRTEAAWQRPEEAFCYFRSDVTSLEFVTQSLP